MQRNMPTVMVIALILVLLFFMLPLAALVWRAIEREGILDYLDDPMVREAMRLSLTTSLTSLAIAIIFGTPVAWLLARWKFPGHRLVETLIDLPIVLPPVVAGVALLMAFGRRGVLGEQLEWLGIQVPFTTLAVIVAQTFVAAPFYIRSAIAGFAEIDRDIELAGEIDGATTLRVLRDISVPAAMPSLAAGAVLCWARALSEFGATLLFAGNLQGRTQTMPLAIMTAFESSLGAALALSVILLVVSFAIIFASRSLTRRDPRTD
ncbi:MAG: ABC transporter permease [Thermomicrobiales bacterium]